MLSIISGLVASGKTAKLISEMKLSDGKLLALLMYEDERLPTLPNLICEFAEKITLQDVDYYLHKYNPDHLFIDDMQQFPDSISELAALAITHSVAIHLTVQLRSSN